MHHALLKDRALLYASGAMPAPERESFDVLLEFQTELRAEVVRLQEAAAELLRSAPPITPGAPPPELKNRILASLGPRPPKAPPEALVVTGPDRRIQWVNPAFTAMCGYTLDELKGRSPAALLQGPATDPFIVARIRTALHANRSCRETLVNHHKDGRTYTVHVSIDPILDDAGQPLWFVARERQLA